MRQNSFIAIGITGVVIVIALALFMNNQVVANLVAFTQVDTPDGTGPEATVGDTLTFLAGPNMTILGDAAADTIQFTSSITGSGAVIQLDLSDDDVLESAAIAEIATTEVTPSIFTEPSPDKFLIDTGIAWPSATALAANGGNCTTGNAPLGVDTLGAVEGCFDVEEETHAAEHAVGAADEVGFYGLIDNEGTPLTARRTLNFIGAGVSCVDDGAGAETDCTITGGGSQNLFETINIPGSEDSVADSATDTLNLTESAGINITGTAASDTINIAFDITEVALTNDRVWVGNGSNLAAESLLPDCTDSAGNHLNYTQSTNAFSCGTSAPLSTVEEEDAGAITVNVFDFGAGFDITESPADEANITFDILEVSLSDDSVWVGTSGGLAAVTPLPNCTDSGGNHLNYTQSSNSFSCGTSGDGFGDLQETYDADTNPVLATLDNTRGGIIFDGDAETSDATLTIRDNVTANIGILLDNDDEASNETSPLLRLANSTSGAGDTQFELEVTAADPGSFTISGDDGVADFTIDNAGVVSTVGAFAAAAAITEAGNAVPNATDTLAFFSATTSAELAGVISNETGTGLLVYGTNPTITTSLSQDGDVADAGYLRLQNAAIIGWEAAPASTDVTLTVDASEIFQFSAPVDVVTGYRIAGAAASATFLRGDGTNFVGAAISPSDLGSGFIDGLGDFAAGLCGTSEILEDQGGSWACISTPVGGADDLQNVYDNDTNPVLATLDNTRGGFIFEGDSETADATLTIRDSTSGKLGLVLDNDDEAANEQSPILRLINSTSGAGDTQFDLVVTTGDDLEFRGDDGVADLTIDQAGVVSTVGGFDAGGAITEASNAVPNSTDTLAFFSATTSSELAGVISNEEGTGLLVFATTPTFTTNITTPVVISGSGDPADAGVLRLGNAELIAWEAAPAAGDITLTVDASEIMQSSGTFNAAILTEGANSVPNSTDTLAFFSATTSAELAGVLSNETGSGLTVFNDSPTFTTFLLLDNEGQVRFEEGGGGTEYIAIVAPASITANRTCVLEDDSTPFDPCITSGGGMTSFDIDADNTAPQTITNTNTALFLGGTNGIDTVASATDTITFNFDATEVGAVTWLPNANLTWTFDIAAAGTNPTLAFATSSMELDANFTIDDEQELRLKEEDTGGENYVGFKAPAAVTANGICTLLDSTTDIVPDTCVGGILADELIALGSEVSGQLPAANGGTGLDTSSSTGVARVTAGTWTFDAGVSHLATSSSADLSGVLSDETGSGLVVFGTNPAITFNDDQVLTWGTGGDVLADWSTADASNHSFVLGLGAANAAIHLANAGDVGTDWILGPDTDPQLFIHSDTTPATDYLRIGNHTGSVADIDVVGGTSLQLQIGGGNEAVLTATALDIQDNNLLTTGTVIDALTDLASGLCGTSEILEDQGGSWACIATPTGTFTSFDIDADNNSPQTITNGNEALFVGGLGIDTTAAVTDQITFDFDAAEIGTETWLDNADRTWTFDIAAAGTNPTLAFAASSMELDANFTIDDEQELRLKEEDGGGENYVGFKAPAAVTGNGICTLLDSTTDIIPDTCVGGILADEEIALGSETSGGYAASTGEAGGATSLEAGALDALTEIAAALCGTNEILEDTGASWACIATPVSGMTSFNLDGDNNSPQTITNGNEALIAGGAGILTTASATDTVTIATASGETDFLASGALTCGASTQGQTQVHTTPLQYCDNAGTPALQYAAYGASDGDALAGDSASSFFDAGQIEAARGGTGDDTSGSTGVAQVTSGNWTYDAAIVDLASSTSADLLGVLSDETGGGLAVFGTDPVITLNDDTVFTWGSGSDVLADWSTADASNHAFVLGLGTANAAIHLANASDVATDWTLSAIAEPQLFLHNNAAPITDYLRIGNVTGTLADIDLVGGTDLRLQIDGTDEITITSSTITLGGILAMGSNNITTTGTVDGIDLNNPGNGIEVSGSQYAVVLFVGTDSVGVLESDSGFEFAGAGSDELSLLQGCGDNQILKWDETEDDWNCEADASGGSSDLQGVYDNESAPALIAITNALGGIQLNGDAETAEATLTILDDIDGQVGILLDNDDEIANEASPLFRLVNSTSTGGDTQFDLEVTGADPGSFTISGDDGSPDFTIDSNGNIIAIIDIRLNTDNADITWGAGQDVQFRWSTTDASNHAFVLGGGNTNAAFHFTNQGDLATDWNVAADADAQLFIHSDTTPATDYIRIGPHDGTTAKIDAVGVTTLDFDIGGSTEIAITATESTFSGDVVIGTPDTDRFRGGIISKGILVEDVVDSEDIGIYFTDEAITIISWTCVWVGTTPSTAVDLRHSTDRSAAGNDVDTATNTCNNTTTPDTFNSGFEDATVPADSYIWFETASTSGTTDLLHIQIVFTVD